MPLNVPIMPFYVFIWVYPWWRQSSKCIFNPMTQIPFQCRWHLISISACYRWEQFSAHVPNIILMCFPISLYRNIQKQYTDMFNKKPILQLICEVKKATSRCSYIMHKKKETHLLFIRMTLIYCCCQLYILFQSTSWYPHWCYISGYIRTKTMAIWRLFQRCWASE